MSDGNVSIYDKDGELLEEIKTTMNLVLKEQREQIFSDSIADFVVHPLAPAFSGGEIIINGESFRAVPVINWDLDESPRQKYFYRLFKL